MAHRFTPRTPIVTAVHWHPARGGPTREPLVLRGGFGCPVVHVRGGMS